MENYPIFLPALWIAGLKTPKISAIIGAGWCVSRVVYAVGYTNPDKENGKGRYNGLSFFFAQWALMALSGWTAVDLLML